MRQIIICCSWFALDSVNQRMRCFRRQGERFHENKIQKVTNRGYGSVLVWSGIVGGRKTPLVRKDGQLSAKDHIDQVIHW